MIECLLFCVLSAAHKSELCSSGVYLYIVKVNPDLLLSSFFSDSKLAWEVSLGGLLLGLSLSLSLSLSLTHTHTHTHLYGSKNTLTYGGH